MRHELHYAKNLLEPLAPPSGKAGAGRRPPIVLDRSMTVAEAFAAVARGCVGHIANAAADARESDDPEGIHQLRVGIRRLRAACSTFRAALPARGPAIVERLRTLQRQLGAARELDVLLEETIASMPERLRTRREMRGLIKAVEARRAAGHRRARAALASPRCANLLCQLGPAIDRYVERSAARTAPAAADQPIAEFAADVLQARHRKARKLGTKVGRLDHGELHALRIRIKKLRYAAEFFRDLWPGRRTERYVRALKDLQQALGTAHDAIVALTLVADVGKRGGPCGKHAATLVRRWAHRCLGREVERLDALWRQFARCKHPWKEPGHRRSRLRADPLAHGPRWMTLYQAATGPNPPIDRL